MTITRLIQHETTRYDAFGDGTWTMGIHPASRFWSDVQSWLAAGNIPEQPPPPPPPDPRRAALVTALEAFDQDANPSVAKVKPVLRALRDYVG